MPVPRFAQLRKEKLTEKVLFPSRKGRHQRLDLQTLIQRAEEDYIDFQDVLELQRDH